jgi:uncharacterized membrane protein HdeD (DUF308 family)
VKPFLLILALAAFWGISGLVVSFGLNAMFGGEWALTCTSLNVIAGITTHHHPQP